MESANIDFILESSGDCQPDHALSTSDESCVKSLFTKIAGSDSAKSVLSNP